jgi:uncharacterized membrane protein YfcA
MSLILICAFALLAGFVDAIAGGGGLIQLPALFIFAPQLPTASLFGTNKFAGFSGTVVSTYQYIKSVKAEWKLIISSLFVAAFSALAGAHYVSRFSKDKIAPVVALLLVVMLIYSVIKKKKGITDEHLLVSRKKAVVILTIAAAVIGFYDGFFGPGAGSLLMFVFISLLRFDFLHAALHTKLFNLVTNLGALCLFVYNNNVVYHIAVPVAICNVSGSYFGVKLALNKGSRLIRLVYLVVVSALIIKLVYDYILK